MVMTGLRPHHYRLNLTGREAMACYMHRGSVPLACEGRGMEDANKTRSNRLGIYLSGLYVLVVAAVYGLTALSAKPSDVGYEWVPFIMLAMPWVRMGQAQEFLLLGLIANAVILYLFGTLFETARRRHSRKSTNKSN